MIKNRSTKERLSVVSEPILFAQHVYIIDKNLHQQGDQKGSIERDPFFILKAKRKKKPLKGAVKDRDGVYGKEKTSLIATSLLRSREFSTQ
ncbi:hypothetical protein [Providencia stuartii]|nr:hypothetical protein G3A48_20760 [Providencia stuartii]SST05123.1 Uncharacterised protein [Acinetobacter baumannii]